MIARPIYKSNQEIGTIFERDGIKYVSVPMDYDRTKWEAAIKAADNESTKIEIE